MNPSLDWAGNISHMIGFESEEVQSLMRLYMVLHADHVECNVSPYTAHLFFFFFQAEDGIRDLYVTGVQTCALPISARTRSPAGPSPSATKGTAATRSRAAARARSPAASRTPPCRCSTRTSCC